MLVRARSRGRACSCSLEKIAGACNAGQRCKQRVAVGQNTQIGAIKVGSNRHLIKGARVVGDEQQWPFQGNLLSANHLYAAGKMGSIQRAACMKPNCSARSN